LPTRLRSGEESDRVREQGTRADSTAQTGLGWLLGSRLLLAGMSLGLAVTLDRIEGHPDNPAIWGVYWTVAGAFLATIVSGLLVARTSNPRRFAMAQVAIDVAIVTSLVYFSGGNESVFTFLYAFVVLYGALFLDRHGVVFSAGLAASGYGFVVFGSLLGWLPSLGPGVSDKPPSVVIAYWAFYAIVLAGLGSLANSLSVELRRTGAALDRRTLDLHRLRDLHLRTVESMSSGLLTTDDDGRITSFNPLAERITGLVAPDAVGRSLEEVIPGASAVVTSPGEAPEASGAATRQRLAYHSQRGEELFLGLAASSLLDERGEALGHVVIFQDVTSVVSMEVELRQSERLAAVGEMAARIAHEIRNPLASISGSVQILQSSVSGWQDDDEPRRLMNIVVREVDRLNDLIGDFLLYSRPAKLRLERIRVSELVEEVAKMSEGQSPGHLRVDLDLDSSVEVMADPALMKAVVWNLWNNAVEAVVEPGTLRARVGSVPGDRPQEPRPSGRKEDRGEPCAEAAPGLLAFLEIEDSGPGISAAAQDMIFEPFFTTKRDGTGLGLATVQRIVEQHGGSIQAWNAPGSGAVFRVLLECAGGPP